MKITKARLKEIIKEEVVKIFEEKKPRWIYVDDEESGKSLGIWASSVPEAEEKSEKVDYSKYKDGDDVMSTKKVDEVQKIVVSEVDAAQQGLTQARKDATSGVSPEEKEEVSNLTNMIVAYSKKKNLTQGRVGKLIELLKQEMSKQMSEGSEEELDEMSAMSTGAVATSPKKEPLEEEDGFYEPHI